MNEIATNLVAAGTNAVATGTNVASTVTNASEAQSLNAFKDWWAVGGIKHINPLLAADEETDVGQNLEVFGNIRLGQAGGGDQLRHILLAIADGENQFEPVDFPQCTKTRCHQLNGCFGHVLK